MKKIFSKSNFLFKFSFLLGVFLLSANLSSAAVTITVTASTSTPIIKYGQTAKINFTYTGSPTRCYLNGDTTNLVTSGFSVSPTVTTTYNITCDDYVAVASCDAYMVPLTSCFIADTKVLLLDGTSKNIQDVKIGDVLKGETSNNRVLGFHDPKLEDGKLYSFNGGRYFVTAEHPFKTTGGWKSINPKKTLSENIGITVTELKVGDTLITENGKVLLKTIDSKNDKANTQLYNFKLDGDHTYYADGYLVHNKANCSASMGYSCGSGQVCLDGSGMPAQEGTCAVCPGLNACSSGYSASCSGGYTVCTQNSGCSSTSTTGSCTGTVVGSHPTTYEGQSCSQFTTSSTCLQGWATHGCSWSVLAN